MSLLLVTITKNTCTLVSSAFKAGGGEAKFPKVCHSHTVCGNSDSQKPCGNPQNRNPCKSYIGWWVGRPPGPGRTFSFFISNYRWKCKLTWYSEKKRGNINVWFKKFFFSYWMQFILKWKDREKIWYKRYWVRYFPHKK